MMQGLADAGTALPANLGAEAMDPGLLLEASQRLIGYHAQTRTMLFKLLAQQLLLAPEATLNASVAELAELKAYFSEGSEEATLTACSEHLRDTRRQLAALTDQRAAEVADREVQTQLSQFEFLMAQGKVSEAAWSLLQLRKTIQEEARHASGSAAAGAQDGAAGALGTPGEAGAPTQQQHDEGPSPFRQAAEQHAARCHQVQEQLVQLVVQGVTQSIQWERHQTVHADTPQELGVLTLRGSVLLPVQGQTSRVRSKEVWLALKPCGLQDEHIKTLADMLMQCLMGCLVEGSMEVVRTDPGAASSAAGHDVVLTVRRARGAPDSPRDVCKQVLEGLLDAVFEWDEHLSSALGAVLWQQLTDAYVSAYVTPAASAASGDTAVLHGLVQGAHDLEKWAIDSKIVDGPVLAPAVAAAVHKLEARQQERPLAMARDALLEDLKASAGSVVVGSPLAIDSGLYKQLLSGQAPRWQAQDPGCGLATADALLLSGGTYTVGQGAVQVAQLVGQLLEQARGAGSRVAAAALVHSCYKIVALAQTLPRACPATREQLDTVFGVALRQIAGMLYLADALVAGHQVWSPDLQTALGEELKLIEYAAYLRQDAQARLTQHVASETQELLQMAATGYEGFVRLNRGGSAAQQGITYRKTTNKVLLTMQRMGKLLAEHMPPHLTAHVARQVLGALCNTMVADIMAKSDIGEDDCKELVDVLSPLAYAGVEQLVQGTEAAAAEPGAPAPQSPKAGRSVSGVPVAVVQQSVISSCMPLRRLQAVLEVLAAKLKDIQAGWESGKLQSMGLQAEEAVHLVCAIFQASDKREAVVARIRAMRSWASTDDKDSQ